MDSVEVTNERSFPLDLDAWRKRADQQSRCAYRRYRGSADWTWCVVYEIFLELENWAFEQKWRFASRDSK